MADSHDEQGDQSMGGRERFCGCKVTTTTMRVGDPVRVVCIECGGVVR